MLGCLLVCLVFFLRLIRQLRNDSCLHSAVDQVFILKNHYARVCPSNDRNMSEEGVEAFKSCLVNFCCWGWFCVFRRVRLENKALNADIHEIDIALSPV